MKPYLGTPRSTPLGPSAGRNARLDCLSLSAKGTFLPEVYATWRKNIRKSMDDWLVGWLVGSNSLFVGVFGKKGSENRKLCKFPGDDLAIQRPPDQVFLGVLQAPTRGCWMSDVVRGFFKLSWGKKSCPSSYLKIFLEWFLTFNHLVNVSKPSKGLKSRGSCGRAEIFRDSPCLRLPIIKIIFMHYVDRPFAINCPCGSLQFLFSVAYK